MLTYLTYCMGTYLINTFYTELKDSFLCRFKKRTKVSIKKNNPDKKSCVKSSHMRELQVSCLKG